MLLTYGIDMKEFNNNNNNNTCNTESESFDRPEPIKMFSDTANTVKKGTVRTTTENSRKNNKSGTFKLTLGAMMCALSVVILYLGSTIEVLDLSMAAIASLLCIVTVIEVGGPYPWVVFSVTAVLSLLLLPQKTPALFYTAFLGYYPLIKEKLEALKKGISYALKLIIFNVALAVSAILFFYLFAPEILLKTPFIIAGVILLNAVFIIYDIALTRLITFYIYRISPKFSFLNKRKRR